MSQGGNGTNTGRGPGLGPSRDWAKLALAAALGWAAIAQILGFLMRADGALARAPIVDAKAYWAWAGRIAGGELVADTPFFSAPLYPYVLGMLRAAGGGLSAAYLLNGVLWIACAGLVGRLAWRRYGPSAGALAAWVFVLLQDPFASTGRILAGPLQCLVVALVIERAEALQEAPTRGRAIALGLATGLACLAWPVLLPAALILGLWAAWALRAPLLGAAVTLSATLAILPATLHNVAACGEWIPISAHGGVTFYHGNNAAADGTFSPLGVSSEKEVQNREARDLASADLGREANWSEVSSHFFGRGLDWWKSAPGEAAALGAVKLRYFLFGSNYGDIYPRGAEAAEPDGRWLHLAPLPVAGVLCLAFVALAFGLLRDPRRHVPDLVLLGAGLGVCVVFWYTPRYRLPVIPVAALLAGWGLAQIAAWGRAPRAAGLCAGALAIGLGSGLVNSLTGFDTVERQVPWFQMVLGQAHRDLGELDEAEGRFRRALELGEGGAEVRLADLTRERGDYTTALVETAQLADRRPEDYLAQRTFAVTLAQAGRPAEAVVYFERALALAPDDLLSAQGLGQARAESGDFAGAIQPLLRAKELSAGQADVDYLVAFCQIRIGERVAGIQGLKALLTRTPGNESARQLLVEATRAGGDIAGALAALKGGLEQDPEHMGMGFVYAWMLATTRADELRDGDEAVRVATGLCERTDYSQAEIVDVLAAALAEAGRFDEASQRAAQALELLPADADDMLRAAIEARVQDFAAGKPYRE